MIRAVVCLALTLALGSGFAAEKKKEDKKSDTKQEKSKKAKGKTRSAVDGVVKKFDAATGVLTLAVQGNKGQAPGEKEFKLTNEVRFMEVVGGKAKFSDFK